MKHHPIVLLSGLLLTVVMVSACGQATPPPASTTAAPATAVAPLTTTEATVSGPVVLELVGPAESQSFTLEQLKALPATEGYAGIKSSTGRITPPAKFTGVSLETLLGLIGGLQEDQGANIVAEDGYAMTMSYAQALKGDFIAYDPATGDEIEPEGPLTVILAYAVDGQPLPQKSDGTLRIVVVSPKNDQVVDGHWSVKWVNKIEIKSLAEDWQLHLEGALVDDTDRGSFESCAAPGCHGATWTDDKAQEWSGVPLWVIVGRMDDEVKHDTGAFNLALADRGYLLELVARDGYTVTLESARIKKNNNIILAHLVNGNPLDEKYFPLRLVGADLQKNEMAGQIAALKLHLGAQAAASETPPPTEMTAIPAVPAGNAALTINGLVKVTLGLSRDALEGMEVVKVTAGHPKKGEQKYEGVRLNALLDMAQVKPEAKTLVMTSGDGYVSEIALADVRVCANCLLAFDDDGKLNAIMPGMQSNFWSKDVVMLELK